MRQSLLLLLILLASLTISTGCLTGAGDGPTTFATSPNFHGKITLAVAEPHNDTDELRTYHFDLDAGTLDWKAARTPSGTRIDVQQFATGGVNCYRSPQLRSPDGRFTAHCEGPFPGLPRGTQADSIVVEDASGKQVFKQAAWHVWRICGYAWSPDSNSIAVAESSSHMSVAPFDLIAALGGHPVPRYTYYIELYKVDGSAGLRLPFARENSRLGFGVLSGWNL